MNKTLDHLPKQKQEELHRIADVIREHCSDVEMIILFGSYARGDWKDGPHEQGRGKLVIHKKSDYDILVITGHEYTATDINLWDNIKNASAKEASTYVRIIARDVEFVNYKLMQGQYFFTEIIEQGIALYNSGKIELEDKKELDPSEAKRIAQADFEEVFSRAKDFYDHFEYGYDKQKYKIAAFQLNQACEHAYKAVLLVFASECPQEHHLDILGKLAEDYCPELIGIFPNNTQESKELFDLLDYAYIGARYDRNYKVTKQQLEKLVPYAIRLHKVVEENCRDKIENYKIISGPNYL